MRARLLTALIAVVTTAIACTGAASPSPAPASSPATTTAPASPSEHPFVDSEHIQHVIFIVQENRSFDHYFGTFPGAEGLPIDPVDGQPRACVPDPILGGESCTYHSSQNRAKAGPHDWESSALSVNDGAMDGFVRLLVAGPNACADDCLQPKSVSEGEATMCSWVFI